ncbi:MAG: hypothetical protein PVJ86_12700, partial [Phycisphaerales bacterium]
AKQLLAWIRRDDKRPTANSSNLNLCPVCSKLRRLPGALRFLWVRSRPATNALFAGNDGRNTGDNDGTVPLGIPAKRRSRPM